MIYTSYPTEAELQAFLVNAGVVGTPPEGVQIYLDGAAEEWESKTGYKPFIADAEDSTSYYDAPYPSRFLDLCGAFVSITSLNYGVTSTSDGTDGTANSDYFAHYRGDAIVGIEFTGLPYGQRSIKIVGKKGFCTEIPARVYRAILEKAAADYSAVATQVGDVKRIKQGPVEYELNESQISKWAKSFDELAKTYKRI